VRRDKLAECESEQARAKQQDAGCGYREKSAGHEVMMMHGTPSTPEAGPNLLNISESAFW
jgi:hypothetical protein